MKKTFKCKINLELKIFQIQSTLKRQLQNHVLTKKINNSSVLKNSAHVDFSEKSLDNVRFVKVNSMPAVGDHLTAEYDVDQAVFKSVNETSLLRLGLVKNLT